MVVKQQWDALARRYYKAGAWGWAAQAMRMPVSWYEAIERGSGAEFPVSGDATERQRWLDTCPHSSLSGAEGPVSKLGRWPTRWRCDSCEIEGDNEFFARVGIAHGPRPLLLRA